MKKVSFLLILMCCLSAATFAQTKGTEKIDSLGLPGDNLNLTVVLQLFQESETLEDFEKKLNQESLNVNNLDLNNDEKTDYIKVIDNKTGDAHAIVLQTNVNDKETQDIAVIEVEKDKAGKTVVQIVGDEELYGKDYIIEPKENDKSADEKTVINNNTTNNYYNNDVQTDQTPKVYVSVNAWPVVTYMYAPSYVVYVSPWYWSYYPRWWNPWRPWYWHNYYWHHYNYHHNHYHGHYWRTGTYRNQGAHAYYGPRRVNSGIVKRNRTAGIYSNTYKREGNGMNNVKPSRPNPGYNKPNNQPIKNNNKPSETANPGYNKPNNQPVKNNNAGATPKPRVKSNPSPRNNSYSKPPNSQPTQKPSPRPSKAPGPSKGGGGKRK